MLPNIFSDLSDKLSLWREQVKNGVYNAPTNIESKNAEIYKEILRQATIEKNKIRPFEKILKFLKLK